MMGVVNNTIQTTPTKMATVPVRPRLFQDLDTCFNKHRLIVTPLNLLLILYLPIGLLLFVVRICMMLQALLILFIIPKGPIQRYLLRVCFGVMGLIVITKDFQRRTLSARMLVSNRISHIDHIPLHLALDCTTTSLVGNIPILSSLFYHHDFDTEDVYELEDQLKQLPEFDDNVSIPDSAAIPYVVQPEATPTNGKGLLKFSVWPFTVENIVQPVGLSWWRPFDVPFTVMDSTAWSDSLWTMFMPFTIVTVRMLPAVEADDGKPVETFAKKTQEFIAKKMQLSNIQATPTDISMWKEESKSKPPLSRLIPNGTTMGPIISESEFSGVQAPPEVERMVYQVIGVLPHVPAHVARQDLMKTRNVDVTVTSLLEGRIKFDPVPNTENDITPRVTQSLPVILPKTKPKKQNVGKFPIEECHRTFEERKKMLLEQARRKYIAKHGL